MSDTKEDSPEVPMIEREEDTTEDQLGMTPHEREIHWIVERIGRDKQEDYSEQCLGEPRREFDEFISALKEYSSEPAVIEALAKVCRKVGMTTVFFALAQQASYATNPYISKHKIEKKDRLRSNTAYLFRLLEYLMHVVNKAKDNKVLKFQYLKYQHLVMNAMIMQKGDVSIYDFHAILDSLIAARVLLDDDNPEHPLQLGQLNEVYQRGADDIPDGKFVTEQWACLKECTPEIILYMLRERLMWSSEHSRFVARLIHAGIEFPTETMLQSIIVARDKQKLMRWCLAVSQAQEILPYNENYRRHQVTNETVLLMCELNLFDYVDCVMVPSMHPPEIDAKHIETLMQKAIEAKMRGVYKRLRPDNSGSQCCPGYDDPVDVDRAFFFKKRRKATKEMVDKQADWIEEMYPDTKADIQRLKDEKEERKKNPDELEHVSFVANSDDCYVPSVCLLW